MDSIWRLIINHAIKSQWLARRPELFYACANGTSMCGSVCCIKQRGCLHGKKTSDRTREVFLQEEPLPVINQKSQRRGDEGCPCPQEQAESCGCLLMVPSLHHRPQVPAGWEGSRQPAPSPSGRHEMLLGKENQWLGLHGGLDLDMGTRAMACTILLPSCTDPAGDHGRDTETWGRAGQPGCTSPRQMRFHRRRFTT